MYQKLVCSFLLSSFCTGISSSKHNTQRCAPWPLFAQGKSLSPSKRPRTTVRDWQCLLGLESQLRFHSNYLCGQTWSWCAAWAICPLEISDGGSTWKEESQICRFCLWVSEERVKGPVKQAAGALQVSLYTGSWDSGDLWTAKTRNILEATEKTSCWRWLRRGDVWRPHPVDLARDEQAPTCASVAYYAETENTWGPRAITDDVFRFHQQVYQRTSSINHLTTPQIYLVTPWGAWPLDW